MAYSARILRDSVSNDRVRLTTLEVTIPRIILPEFNTHRVFSRNSSSSRAIPIEKIINKVEEDPFVPVQWGKNKKGMQADEILSDSLAVDCEKEWLNARDSALKHVRILLENGVHKQIVNRLLEPWMWQTIIVTSTEWENYLALRNNAAAQPEIKKGTVLMLDALNSSIPGYVSEGNWHLPLLQPDERVWSTTMKYVAEPWVDVDGSKVLLYDHDTVVRVCVGRCARVSYKTHDGKRDPRADVELCERLVNDGHMSPAEHVARPMTREEIARYTSLEHAARTNELPFCGNLRGWISFRKTLQDEDNFAKKMKINAFAST